MSDVENFWSTPNPFASERVDVAAIDQAMQEAWETVLKHEGDEFLFEPVFATLPMPRWKQSADFQGFLTDLPEDRESLTLTETERGAKWARLQRRWATKHQRRN